ncbi:site-specific integrase, partial [Actinacidiphila oryziradicis]|uniref:site-specific integrase n=1 Tax=Actinacidiphila oryziradicis TaxID=2571141 RepID=UPI001FED1F3F
MLHDMGHFPSGTPATLRAAVLSGRRTVQELVDRYDIRHQGVRQLLLDYLRRREPEMDCSTLDQLSRSLAACSGPRSKPSPPASRTCGSAPISTSGGEALGTHQDGRKQREEFEHILRSVRSFYTDLHSWAVEEPEKWAPWVAPCPVPDGALRGVIVRQRRGKERMDDRVRQRQPLLPVLVAHLEDRYHHLRALLQTASPLTGGQTVTVNGRAYERVWTAADDRRARRGGQANTRVRDLGNYINVTTAEDLAFWEFAAVEVLRHAGIRIEEFLELTHLSIRQYQRPNGEVIALLVIAPSKTDRERVIPMSAELFAVIAAIIRRHTQHGRPIPIIQRYDNHERRMSDPMPFLFQRHTGAVPRVISPATGLVMLRRRCAELAEQHPSFRATSFTPHDFRRLVATDLVNNGLPIHIGAALLGHLNLQTTRRYVAVFNEDVVRHYQEFLDRRRQARSADEYKPVTNSEWSEFEEHFDRRKVELASIRQRDSVADLLGGSPRNVLGPFEVGRRVTPRVRRVPRARSA